MCDIRNAAAIIVIATVTVSVLKWLMLPIERAESCALLGILVFLGMQIGALEEKIKKQEKPK